MYDRFWVVSHDLLSFGTLLWVTFTHKSQKMTRQVALRSRPFRPGGQIECECDSEIEHSQFQLEARDEEFYNLNLRLCLDAQEIGCFLLGSHVSLSIVWLLIVVCSLLFCLTELFWDVYFDNDVKTRVKAHAPCHYSRGDALRISFIIKK